VRLLLALIIVACGSKPPPAPPPPTPGSGSVEVPPPPPVDASTAAISEAPLDQDLDRLAERSVALYGEIVKAFEAAGESCATATVKLGEITRSYADVIAANAKVLHEGRHMQLKLALRRFDDQFQRAAKAIVQSKTVAACFKDEGFARALDELVGKRP
jgi:hypothetical protein